MIINKCCSLVLIISITGNSIALQLLRDLMVEKFFSDWHIYTRFTSVHYSVHYPLLCWKVFQFLFYLFAFFESCIDGGGQRSICNDECRTEKALSWEEGKENSVQQLWVAKFEKWHKWKKVSVFHFLADEGGVCMKKHSFCMLLDISDYKASYDCSLTYKHGFQSCCSRRGKWECERGTIVFWDQTAFDLPLCHVIALSGWQGDRDEPICKPREGGNGE